jgi:hypothetical protein
MDTMSKALEEDMAEDTIDIVAMPLRSLTVNARPIYRLIFFFVISRGYYLLRKIKRLK